MLCLAHTIAYYQGGGNGQRCIHRLGERKVNLKTFKQLAKILYRRQVETGQRFSIEIESGPGMGKSEGTQQVAQELGMSRDKGGLGIPFGFKPFFLSTLEQPDVRGFGLPSLGVNEAGRRMMDFTLAPWVPGDDEPDHGILFLDEFRQSAHDVQKPAAELLLNGQVGDSKLPIGWMVIAASNREKDRSGVQRELAFIANRRMLIKITPDLDSWVEWAEHRTNDINWAAIAFAKAHPGKVFGETVPEKSGPFCTPRTLVKMSYIIDQMPIELFTEAAAGLVGEGVAAEFCSFLRVVEQLPKFEDIVAKPSKCKLPDTDRPDAQYAVMQMIAHRVNGDNATSAFTYLKRMSQEFQVAGLKATLRRCPEIVQSKDFATWLRDNKDLIMSANLLDRN